MTVTEETLPPRVMDEGTALRLLTEVVEEYGPEHHYEYTLEEQARHDNGQFVGCRYIGVNDYYSSGMALRGDSAPRCIVGHVLAKWDPEEWTTLRTVWSNDSASALERTDGVVTTRAGNLLLEAQKAQDAGKTWGEALELAREVLA